MKKTALITGIAGQDGSYLAELLLGKEYEVHGTVRRVAFEDPTHRLWRVSHIADKITLHGASLESYANILGIVDDVKPDECYHLAAHSFVTHSFENDLSVINSNISMTHCLLSALKRGAPECRLYFAASSEMFGKAPKSPQNEDTPFYPRSLYGISKLAGFHLMRNYREKYGMHASSGILFNHESPRRGYEYVTRKITSHAARIKLGLEEKIRLGNLDARRDWGHAKEYVEAMWLMLQEKDPDDYVIATGKCYSVRDLLESAFSYVDLDPYKYLVIEKDLFRSSETTLLRGDPTKARKRLNWSHRVSFDNLVMEMVESDLKYFKTEINKKKSGPLDVFFCN